MILLFRAQREIFVPARTIVKLTSGTAVPEYRVCQWWARDAGRLLRVAEY
jgi:hypothetical protein